MRSPGRHAPETGHTVRGKGERTREPGPCANPPSPSGRVGADLRVRPSPPSNAQHDPESFKHKEHKERNRSGYSLCSLRFLRLRVRLSGRGTQSRQARQAGGRASSRAAGNAKAGEPGDLMVAGVERSGDRPHRAREGECPHEPGPCVCPPSPRPASAGRGRPPPLSRVRHRSQVSDGRLWWKRVSTFLQRTCVQPE